MSFYSILVELQALNSGQSPPWPSMGLGAFNNAIACTKTKHALYDDALDKLQKIYMHKPHPVCQLGIETVEKARRERESSPKRARLLL